MSVRPLCAALAAIVLATACKKDSTAPLAINNYATVVKVAVAPTAATLPVGGTIQISVIFSDSVGGVITGRTVGWTSSDTTVATVLPSGLVTGVGAGKTTITATSVGTLALPSASTTLTVLPVSTTLSFAQVKPGYLHSCATGTNGLAYCWGDNSKGQLGNAASSTTTPFRIADTLSLNFASLSAGYFHSCGVTAAGTAYCWGADELGELGTGTAAATLTATAVKGGVSYQTVSAGYFHSCGVTSAGVANCWGDNGYGGLGNGTAITSSSPVAVGGGLTFASVGAGFYHSCGIQATGQAWLIGNGRGAGSLKARREGARVPGITRAWSRWQRNRLRDANGQRDSLALCGVDQDGGRVGCRVTGGPRHQHGCDEAGGDHHQRNRS